DAGRVFTAQVKDGFGDIEWGQGNAHADALEALLEDFVWIAAGVCVLPEHRGIGDAWTHTIGANSIGCVVKRHRSGKSKDRVFGCRVDRCGSLTYEDADGADVDDVAARLPFEIGIAVLERVEH